MATLPDIIRKPIEQIELGDALSLGLNGMGDFAGFAVVFEIAPPGEHGDNYGLRMHDIFGQEIGRSVAPGDRVDIQRPGTIQRLEQPV